VLTTLHNKNLRHYKTFNKSLDVECSTYGGWELVHKELWWENLRGKRPLGRPRHRWEDNIKMDLQEVEWRIFEYFSKFC
jgi:hypothetical protein